MTTTTARSTLAEIVNARTGRDTTPPREFRTRTATGTPPDPLVLVAGRPKTGKSYALAAAAADPRVARVTVVEVGLDDGALDGYLDVAGDKLQIVAHDNTAQDVVAAIQQAAAQPPTGDGYNILAIDSATVLWALLSREAQRGGRDIGPGGWAMLNSSWDDILTVLRTHAGPVILTARADDAGLDDLGRVRVQKDLAFDVDVVVQAAAHRDFTLVGARSLALASLKERVPLPLGDLDIPSLLDLLSGGAR